MDTNLHYCRKFMQDKALYFIFGAVCSLFLLIGSNLVVSFGTAAFSSTVLASIVTIVLLVWLVGTISFWLTFQDLSNRTVLEHVKTVGTAAAWPAWFIVPAAIFFRDLVRR